MNSLVLFLLHWATSVLKFPLLGSNLCCWNFHTRHWLFGIFHTQHSLQSEGIAWCISFLEAAVTDCYKLGDLMTKIYFLKALGLEVCNQGLSRATLPPESLGENLFLAPPSCCQMAVGIPCLGAMSLQSPPVFTLPPPLWSECLILSPFLLSGYMWWCLVPTR